MPDMFEPENDEMMAVPTADSIELEHETPPEEVLTECPADGCVKDDAGDTLSSVFDWMDAAVFALVLVTILFSCICRTVGVNGTSMMNTLMHQDRLLLRTNFYTPRHGDVVVVNIPGESEPLIKRVIGVGEDELRIDPIQNIVYRNGKPLEEPYVDDMYPLTYGVLWRNDLVDDDGTVHIPAGKIFVMGDHRNLSKDSRYPEVGLVDVEDVMGEAFFRIYPFNTIGTF